MRWIAALLSFIFLAGAALFGLFGNGNGAYSPDSYPEVYSLMKGKGLEVMYTPALAVVSPSRTDYLNITFWVRNTENIPKIVTLRFREPASLVSTSADVLSDYRDVNGDVTYRTVSFVLPEKAERMFKIQLKNIYRVLETDKEEYTVSVSTDAEEIKVPVMLYSQSVPYTSIWPYHAALQDDPKRITLLLDPTDVRHFRGNVFHLRAYRAAGGTFTTSQTAEVRLVQRFTGTVRFTYRARSNSNAAKVEYFRVKAYTVNGVETLVEINNLKGSDTGWVEFNVHVRGLEKLVFEAKLTVSSYKTAEVWIRDLYIGDGYDIAYYTVRDILNNGSWWHTAIFEFNVPPTQYRWIVLVPQWNNSGRKDWGKVYVYDGSWHLVKTVDLGDTAYSYANRGYPIYIDGSQFGEISKVKIETRTDYTGATLGTVAFYGVPEVFPDVQAVLSCGDTEYTLTRTLDGGKAHFQLPEGACAQPKEDWINEVPLTLRVLVGDSVFEQNVTVRYILDSDRDLSLLWEKYLNAYGGGS